MTDLSRILTIVAGVSSLIGFLSIALTLYFWLAQKQREDEFKRSIRQVVEGDRFFNADQVIAVLEKFQDDEARLKALKALAAHEAKAAAALLAKIKDKVDLKQFDEAQRKGSLTRWAIISAVFIVIAVLAILAKFQAGKVDDDNRAKICTEINERLAVLQQVEDRASLRNKCSIEPVTNGTLTYSELLKRANRCDAGCFVPILERAERSISTRLPDITLTYLYASAGAGKSTFFRETWSRSQTDPCDKTCTFTLQQGVDLRIESLKEWFKTDVPKQPNLTLIPSGQAVNSLPGDEKTAATIARKILKGYDRVKNKTILLLDDLDELHPTAAKSILKEVDEFISAQSGTDTAHIIVAGRAEGFIGYERKQTSVTLRFQAVRFRLPVFQSSEDIRARYDNFVDYRKRTTGSDSASFDVVQRTLSNRAFLCESFSIQMLGGPIISNAVSWSDSHNENEIKDELLNEMFTRNQKSHGRPPAGDPNYRHSIAMAVLQQLSPRPHDGDFFVTFDARVPYGDQMVNVNELLDRSGLVQRDPIDIKRYKFVPNWVPAHLLRTYAREQGCQN